MKATLHQNSTTEDIVEAMLAHCFPNCEHPYPRARQKLKGLLDVETAIEEAGYDSAEHIIKTIDDKDAEIEGLNQRIAELDNE